MTSIDTYGEFDLPEETERIEVVEDPVKIINASYELFKNISSKILQKYDWFRDDGNVVFEKIYETAEKLLEDKKNMKLSKEQIKRIFRLFSSEWNPAYSYYANGLFLSALQNCTDLDVLIINNKYFDAIGHKLKKNKTVVIGPSLTINKRVGQLAEGNTINRGNITYQGIKAKNGVHINASHINLFSPWNDWAQTGNGLYINIGTIIKTEGSSGEILHESHEPLIISRSERKIIADANKEPLKPELEQLLKEIEFLKITPINKLADKIRQFDFNDFKQRVEKELETRKK